MQAAAEHCVSPHVTSTLPWAWRAICPVSRISFLPASSSSMRAGLGWVIWSFSISLFVKRFLSVCLCVFDGSGHASSARPTNRSRGASDARGARPSSFLGAASRGGTAAPGSLPAQAQALDDGLVALGVPLPQVPEELAALTHHDQKPAPRGVVLAVGLQVLGQVLDVLAQDRDLH